MSQSNLSQHYIHYILAVKHPETLLNELHRKSLFLHICEALMKMNHLPIIVNGMPDHVHILTAQNASIDSITVVEKIKANSTKFINNQKWFTIPFEWQQAYAAFDCERDTLFVPYAQVADQVDVHATKSFEQEYKEGVKQYGLDNQASFTYLNFPDNLNPQEDHPAYGEMATTMELEAFMLRNNMVFDEYMNLEPAGSPNDF